MIEERLLRNYEIFVREYGQRYELLFQEAEERRKVIGETSEATASYAQRYAHGNEEEWEELLREYGIQAQFDPEIQL